MASGVYNISKGGALNWASGGDDIRMLLVNASHTFNPDHTTVADIDANECVGTGYSRVTPTGRVLTPDNTNDELEHDMNDVEYGGADFGTVHGGVTYIYNASDSLTQLVAYSELASDVVTNGGSFTFQVGAEGFYKGT
jgi:hypothetical protein